MARLGGTMFPENHTPGVTADNNPFLRLCAIVAHLREQGVAIPAVLGALPGPQQTFEAHLRTKFHHTGFQAWLLVKPSEGTEGEPAWQCHTHLTILQVTTTAVEAMIVAWACDNGTSWWLDVDFVCADRLELVRQWVVDALPLARYSTQADRTPTHVRIGSSHRVHFSDHMAGRMHVWAAPQGDPHAKPWCWHWTV